MHPRADVRRDHRGRSYSSVFSQRKKEVAIHGDCEKIGTPPADACAPTPSTASPQASDRPGTYADFILIAVFFVMPSVGEAGVEGALGALDVEAEVYDVAFLHDVLFALGAEAAGGS